MLFLCARTTFCLLHALVPVNDGPTPVPVNLTITPTQPPYQMQVSIDIITFLLNRSAFGFLFTAFTLVVFYWAENVHKSYYESFSFLPTLGVCFLFTNVLVWIFQVVIVVLFAITEKEVVWEGNTLYDSSILIDIAVSFLISLGFLFYGTRLSITKFRADNNDPTRMREAIKIIFTAICFTLCFLLRVSMFSYRFITNAFLPDVLFVTLAYYLPELIPSVLQIYIVESSRGKSRRESQYINDLYAGQVDTTFEEAIRSVQYDSNSNIFVDGNLSNSTLPISESTPLVRSSVV